MDSENSVSGDVHGQAVQIGTVYGNVVFGRPGPDREVGVSPSWMLFMVPHQLPSPTPCFVDRADLFRDMTTALDVAVAKRELARIVLTGSPGNGRFSAVCRWYHDLIDRFPDGSLHIRLGGSSKPDQALRAALHAVGVPYADIPDDLEERKNLLLARITGRRLLIVVTDPVNESQIEAFLPHAPGSAVVVIASRWQGWFVTKCFTTCEVPRLEAPHDNDLLRRLSGKVYPTLDQELVTAALRGCGGIPQVIAAVAAQVVGESWRAVKVLSSFHDLGIDGLSIEGQEAVGKRLDVVYAVLPEDLAAAYRRLGLHLGPVVSIESAAAFWDTDMDSAEALPLSSTTRCCPRAHGSVGAIGSTPRPSSRAGLNAPMPSPGSKTIGRHLSPRLDSRPSTSCTIWPGSCARRSGACCICTAIMRTGCSHTRLGWPAHVSSDTRRPSRECSPNWDPRACPSVCSSARTSASPSRRASPSASETPRGR